MNAFRIHHYAAGRLLWLALAALLMRPLGAVGATEDTFAVLQIGTRTYTNVTVTTKAKNYIFILHAGGMTSIKVSRAPARRPAEAGLRRRLGPEGCDQHRGRLGEEGNCQDRRAASQGPQEATGTEVARQSACQADGDGLGLAPSRIGPSLGIALLLYLLLHLFYCYCCMLICRKAGNPPGILVWLPCCSFFRCSAPPACRAGGFWLTSCRCSTSCR